MTPREDILENVTSAYPLSPAATAVTMSVENHPEKSARVPSLQVRVGGEAHSLVQRLPAGKGDSEEVTAKLY